MTPSQQRTADIERARHILLLFDKRREEFHESRGRAMDLSRIMSTGGASKSARHTPAIDAREAWCMTVAWALFSYGRNVGYILHARLTRRPKSHEASFDQIASELGDHEANVRRIFNVALPVFIMELDAREVKPSLKAEKTGDDEAVPLAGEIRCAATERRMACQAA